MADVTTAQAYDGSRNYQIKLTNYSDGTGQTGVKIIDVTTLVPNPGTHMKLRRIRYNISGMYVRLQWEGTPNEDIVILGNGQDILDFSTDFAGGFPNNAATATGNVLLTTEGALNGSNYTIVLEFLKGV
jgi:hypothetical protein